MPLLGSSLDPRGSLERKAKPRDEEGEGKEEFQAGGKEPKETRLVARH